MLTSFSFSPFQKRRLSWRAFTFSSFQKHRHVDDTAHVLPKGDQDKFICKLILEISKYVKYPVGICSNRFCISSIVCMLACGQCRFSNSGLCSFFSSSCCANFCSTCSCCATLFAFGQCCRSPYLLRYITRIGQGFVHAGPETFICLYLHCLSLPLLWETVWNCFCGIMSSPSVTFMTMLVTYAVRQLLLWFNSLQCLMHT